MGKEYLDADPGEYFFDNCYLSTQPIALPNQNKRAMLKFCRAEETFMYSSDWPHHTIDPVNWVFDSVIEDELRKQILQRNAEACYRL
jgi:predicted TIM-barrel fold metal-dependent hydrolase